MKICFIGIGSIARRHINNLQKIVKGELIIDIVRHTGGKIIDFQVNCQYTKAEEMPEDYDIIFITNPTSMHVYTLFEVMKKAKAFFIEKPLRCIGKDIVNLSLINMEKIYYVACPLRYTNIIQYLKQKVDWNDVYSVRSISSSYLPDWRKNIDYRTTYSSNKNLGGGVASDLIHEWDYLTFLLGMPTSLYKIEKKMSNLEIDSEDIAIYIADYKNKVAEVHLDYFGRSPIRKLELFTREDTIRCDFLKGTIYYQNANQLINCYEERDEFQIAELEHFLKIVAGEIENDSTIEKAEHLIRLLSDPVNTN